MEDAHLSVSPLTDKKNSLFAVFDGHGGKQKFYFRRLSECVCLKKVHQRTLKQS